MASPNKNLQEYSPGFINFVLSPGEGILTPWAVEMFYKWSWASKMEFWGFNLLSCGKEVHDLQSTYLTHLDCWAGDTTFSKKSKVAKWFPAGNSSADEPAAGDLPSSYDPLKAKLDLANFKLLTSLSSGRRRFYSMGAFLVAVSLLCSWRPM